MQSNRVNDKEGIGQWARAANSGDTQALKQLWAQTPEACFQEAVVVSRLSVTNSTDAATLKTVIASWQPWLTELSAFQRSDAVCDDQQALALLQSFSRIGVLCALREGRWGVHAFNRQLQLALGFPDAPWFTGRPVMARRNDYALGIKQR